MDNYPYDERLGIMGENKKPWFRPLGQAITKELQYFMDEWNMSEREAGLLLACFTNSMLYVGDERFKE